MYKIEIRALGGAATRLLRLERSHFPPSDVETAICSYGGKQRAGEMPARFAY